MSRNYNERSPRPNNILEYVRNKTAWQNAGFENGKIFYDGREWSEQEFLEVFPKPVLTYESVQIDGTQIER